MSREGSRELLSLHARRPSPAQTSTASGRELGLYCLRSSLPPLVLFWTSLTYLLVCHSWNTRPRSFPWDEMCLRDKSNEGRMVNLCYQSLPSIFLQQTTRRSLAFLKHAEANVPGIRRWNTLICDSARLDTDRRAEVCSAHYFCK